MYFDWNTWLQEGRSCFINYEFDYGDKKASIMAQAIPHLEVVEVNDDPNYIMTKNGQAVRVSTNRYCDLHVVFTCVADQKDKSLFKMMVEEEL
jgi:hypothetical protein